MWYKPNVYQKKLKSKAESFENKPLHRDVHKEVPENDNNDQKLTRKGTTNKFMTSNFEAHACAITQQEILNEKNYISNYQQNIANVDYVRESRRCYPYCKQLQ